ncbi:MAG: hypothetical protein H6810_04200 [Phycisphaeraceae bacterium]|nr:MAG: hypothetical protein H6810_04200 [Phycisphaeraceae bacterium]
MIPEPGHPQNPLVQSRIIIGALASGCVIFAAVAIVISLTQGPFMPDPQMSMILAGLAGAVLLGALVASFVVARVFARQAGRAAADQPTPEEGERTIAAHYAQCLVIRGALAQGPSLFCITVFMLTGMWGVLAGALVGLAEFAMLFPSEGRQRAFMSRALE